MAVNKKSNRTDNKADNRTGKKGYQQLEKQSKNETKRRMVKNVSEQNAPCPVFKSCGGCQLLDVPYQKQIKKKKERLVELLKPYCELETFIDMENPVHYRHKVTATFGRDRKGNVISGTYKEGTHYLVPVESCLLEHQKADAIIVTIRGLLKSFKIKTYDEDTGYGLLRHVLVRVGHVTGQIMVVLVLASPVMPSKNNFVKALRKEHPEITTVVVNVNDKRTSMVLGEKEQVIYGPGYIEDKLCGCTFKISPKSFYQVNPVQTEKLYKKAIGYAGLTGNETVLDAYCGTGTIGMIASAKAGKVIGVELNKDAVKDAVVNAKKNQINNIRFYQKDAGEFMVQVAESGDKVDVVLMDPPRSGSSEVFLDALCVLSPRKVVYVSCNPETMVRDIKYLTQKGYCVQKACGVDMFPNTVEIETVALLSLKTGQPKLEVTMEVDSDSNYTPEERATYQKIKAYVKEKYGVNVHTSYIAQVKRMCGLDMGEIYNKSKKENLEVKQCPQEKVEYIKDALKHFGVI